MCLMLWVRIILWLMDGHGYEEFKVISLRMSITMQHKRARRRSVGFFQDPGNVLKHLKTKLRSRNRIIARVEQTTWTSWPELVGRMMSINTYNIYIYMYKYKCVYVHNFGQVIYCEVVWWKLHLVCVRQPRDVSRKLPGWEVNMMTKKNRWSFSAMSWYELDVCISNFEHAQNCLFCFLWDLKMDIYCDCWIQNQYVKSQDADWNRMFHKRDNDFLFICLCCTFMTRNKTNILHMHVTASF